MLSGAYILHMSYQTEMGSLTDLTKQVYHLLYWETEDFEVAMYQLLLQIPTQLPFLYWKRPMSWFPFLNEIIHMTSKSNGLQSCQKGPFTSMGQRDEMVLQNTNVVWNKRVDKNVPLWRVTFFV